MEKILKMEQKNYDNFIADRVKKFGTNTGKVKAYLDGFTDALNIWKEVTKTQK